MKKTVIVLFVAFTLLLTSCKGGSKLKTQEASFDKSKYGGTLNLSAYTPDTLNPMSTQYSCISDFLYLVYEGLFVVNEDLSARGVLAEGYLASENNTVYTINLKKGVKFHDGSEFNADDVISTFAYIINYGSHYSDRLKDVSKYTKSDNYTVEIVLKNPAANFVNNLDFPILPSGLAYSDFACPNKSFVPVGTGRYKYSSTEKYRYLELEKNDSWHGEQAVYIPKVNIRFLNSNDAMLHAFNSGETDLISTQRARWGEFPYKTSVVTDEITTTKYVYLGLNTVSGALADVKLRHSLKDALNIKQMIDTAMFSHATAAETPFSSKAYFNITDKSQSKNTEKTDLKKSKLSLYLLYNDDSLLKGLVAEYIKKTLAEKGVDIIFTKVDYETYVNRVQSGNYDIYIGEVNMSRDFALKYMFGEAVPIAPPAQTDESKETGDVSLYEPEVRSAENVIYSNELSRYTDEVLDNLIYNMNLAADSENLSIAYGNFKKYFVENLPQIPLFHVKDAMMMNRRICGKINNNLTNFYADIGEIYIKKK